MAVLPPLQGHGVGRALVEAAAGFARAKKCQLIVVGAATADIGNLRFYQRLGFRMTRIERDAFTPDTGYPTSINIDGIRLRDRVWFDREL